MLKSQNGSEPRISATGLSVPMWSGAPVLKQVHSLNERCLEVLSLLARTKSRRGGIPVVEQNRKLWQSLDLAARGRAARCPFLLIDAHFQREDWWRSAIDRRSRYWKNSEPTNCLPSKAAGELMRETLMLAWRTAAADPGAACILLGITPAVGALIADSGPQDIERIAARHSRHLQLRWAELPLFWRDLLTAANSADDEALHELHLYGVMLLGSELIPLLEKSPAN